MTRFLPFLAAGAALFGAAEAECSAVRLDGADYVVCEFNPQKDDIRLFLYDGAGAPFGDFARVNDALSETGQTLRFAMNAGMYHKDRSPVGLYVENREQRKAASTRDGTGNFHLKPNGIFWISQGSEAGAPPIAIVETTESFLAGAHNIRDATQSGPMLVIDGAIHPKFLIDSTSRKRRNGVGVRDDGTVVFALAETPVTFREFAITFRDNLATPNALYLDGTISRVFAPELARDDKGLPMGPIIGVVVKAD